MLVWTVVQLGSLPSVSLPVGTDECRPLTQQHALRAYCVPGTNASMLAMRHWKKHREVSHPQEVCGLVGKRTINEIGPMKWKVLKREKLDDSAKKDNEGGKGVARMYLCGKGMAEMRSWVAGEA